MHFDPEVFGAAMGDLVRDAIEPLHVRIAELERQLADQPNVDSLVSERVEQASVTFDDVMPALREMTEGYLASLEVPAGKDGADGRDGGDGKDGKDGLNGADGKSITVDDIKPVLDAMQASWALEWERRAQDVLQRAIDRMPVPKDGVDGRDGRDGINGKDGRDALDLDDLEYEQDEDGRVTLRLVRGDVRKEIKLKFPVFVDRGVFKEGERYERGNGVTWGGSFWIAQKDDPEGKPGEGDGFRLAVKKGRDAK